MSHRHYCDYSGHDWQCSENCECICGLPMQGHDHSDCPVEFRACPEHAPEQQRSMAEAMTSEPDAAFAQKWRERPHCECECTEADPSEVVGWCLHCDHVYVECNPKIEDRHFANNCASVPEELKKSARERLAKIRAGKSENPNASRETASQDPCRTSGISGSDYGS